MLDALHRHRALARCHLVGTDVGVVGRIWVHGEGRIEIGDGVRFLGERAPIEIFAHAGATLIIGTGCTIEGGTSLESTASIDIGAGTVIGAFSRVMDNHFHPLLGNRHERPAPRPVVIGQRTMIGPRCVVLAGAQIPPDSRFGAGSVIRGAGRITPASTLVQ